jgi:glucose/arabinose dehydrogenase
MQAQTWFHILFVGALLTISTACQSCSSQNQTTKDSGSIADDREDSSNSPSDDSGDETAVNDSNGDDGCSQASIPALSTQRIAGGSTFNEPVYLTQAPGNNETLFVVEKRGVIQRVEDGSIADEPFLDISSRIDDSFGEEGLLGLAFHPDYQENGRFFVYYTAKGSPTRDVVAEYHRSEQNPDIASDEEVRRFIQPDSLEENHNGGMLTFGPDGYLYAGLGDGGGAGDQHGEIGNGLNKGTLLGSIVRFDVDNNSNDFVPEDNPFVDKEGNKYIWAYGLRNPWRFSFDRKTGDLWVADVGQNKIEEINIQTAETSGGQNYGWRAYEGSQVYDEDLTDRVEHHHAPIIDIPHASDSVPVRDACSVTGGYVYRGDAVPKLKGLYLYGDYCSQDVAAVQYCDGEVVQHTRLPGLKGQGQGLASFAEDHDGELYLIYIGSGEIKKIVPSGS